MTLIICPECKKEISDKSVNCPNCGFPINTNIQVNSLEIQNEKKRLNYKKIYLNSLYFSLAIIAFFMIIKFILYPTSYGGIDPAKEFISQLIFGAPLSALICSLPLFIIVGGFIELYYRIKK